MLRFFAAMLACLALGSGAYAQVPIQPNTMPLVTQTARGAVPQTGTPTGKVLTDSATWSSNMDGVAIGITTPVAGKFTNLTATTNLTLGTGGTTGFQMLVSGPSNSIMKLGGPTSIFSLNNSSNQTLLQVDGGNNFLVSQYQMILHSQGTITPTWVSGTTLATQAPLYSNLTWSGAAPAGVIPLIAWLQSTSGIVAVGGVQGFKVNLTSATGNDGSFIALAATVTQGGKTASVGGNIYTGIQPTAIMTTNDGGTSGAYENYLGAATAINPVLHFTPGATFVAGGSIAEFDVWAEAGSSPAVKGGISIINSPGDMAQGVYDDRALGFSGQAAGTIAGWRTLIQIGKWSLDGNPMDPVNGIVLGFVNNRGAATIVGKGGFDFTNFVPTTFFMKGNGFLLDPSGNWTANSLTATASGTALSVTNNATIGGNLVLSNNAGTTLTVNASAIFGAGGTQTLSISGNVISTGGSSTGFINFRLAQSATQLLRITGNDGAGNFTPVMEINGSTTSSTNFYNQINLGSAQIPAHYDIIANKTITGTNSVGAFAPILFQYTDNMASTVGNGIVGINETQTTSAATGPRITLGASFNLNAPSGNSAGIGGNYTTAGFFCRMQSNDNGTSAGMGTASGGLGNCFSLNTVARATSAATFLSSLTGYELDVQADAGSSINTKNGLSIVELGGDVAQGQWQDDALVFGRSDTQASGKGWKNGIRFGRPQGYFPIDPLGTMIDAGPVSSGTMLAATGIDWSLVTFSSFFLKSQGFTVDGSGNVAAVSYKAGANAGLTCSGTPTASFASTLGIVTHC